MVKGIFIAFIVALLLVMGLNVAGFCWREFAFYSDSTRKAIALRSAYDFISRHENIDFEHLVHTSKIGTESAFNEVGIVQLLFDTIGFSYFTYQIEYKEYTSITTQSPCLTVLDHYRMKGR